MFNPVHGKKYCDKIVISIRISEDIVKLIDRLSYEIDVSRNEYINQCIKFALDHLKKG